MNCKLVISQPAPNAPAGKPYGVSYLSPNGTPCQHWFASETAAWDARDEALDAECRNVRVIGAPCNAFVTM